MTHFLFKKDDSRLWFSKAALNAWTKSFAGIVVGACQGL